MTAATVPARFEITRVVGRALILLRRRPVTIAVLCVLLASPASLLSAWYFSHVSVTAHLNPDGEIDLIYVLEGFALQQAVSTLAGGFVSLLYGGVALAANESEGWPRRSVARGLIRAAVPLYITGVLARLGVVVGTVLLIVPGLLAAVAWRVVAPVVAVEGASIIGAFRRSAELTKGHRLVLLGLLIVLAVMSILLNLLGRGVAGIAGLSPTEPLYQWVVGPTLAVLTEGIYALVVASTYLELRRSREGVEVDGLATVFD